MTQARDEAATEPAGLGRRLVALCYDALLLLSVLFVGTALALLVTWKELDYHNPLFRGYLFGLCFVFYAWFWLHGGQTLGMQAWRLRLQQPDGRPVTFRQALLRFLAAWALPGISLLWILVDRDGMAIHDRLSKTVIVKLPR